MLDITRSEFRKLRSHPLGAVFLAVGTVLPPLLAWLILRNRPDGTPVPSDLAVSATLHALQFGQVAGIVLAATSAGQEYQDHQLRTSLVSVNPRRRLFASKMIAVGVTVVLQCWLSAALAVGVLAASNDVVTLASLDLGRRLPMFLLASACWLQLSWMALGLTIACQSLIPPVAVLGALTLGLNQLFGMLLPFSKYGPTLSTSQVFLTEAAPNGLPPGRGVLVQTAWMLCAVVVAYVLHARRDVR